MNVLTDFVLRCGRGSRKIASAHNAPEFGHSCNALAIIGKAISFSPPLNSTRMASSHKCSFFGFFNRARSSTDLALINWPRRSSSWDNKVHRGIDVGHFFI